jgi:ABC-type transport system substrate-binding protein
LSSRGYGGADHKQAGYQESELLVRKLVVRARGTVVVLTVGVVVLVAACSGSGSDGSGGGSTSVNGPGSVSGAGQGSDVYTPSADADPAGTLKIATIAAPPSFDPIQSGSRGDHQWLSEVYDRLTMVGPSGRTVQPMLATSWITSPNGLTWTFTLRTDATFSDGTKVDASAVKQSLDRLLSAGSAYAKGYLSGVTAVAAPSATEVVLTLSKPNDSLPASLSTVPTGIVCPSALAAAATLATKPCGSGAYDLSKGTQTEATYIKRTAYWDAAVNKAAPAKLIVTSVKDQKARVNAMITGDFDAAMTFRTTPADLAGLPSSIKQVTSSGSNAALITVFNLKEGPLADPKVRQAISLAIDRKALSALSAPGTCVPRVQMSDKGTVGYVPGLDTDAEKVDLEGAKKLLAAAGVPNGFSTKLLTLDSGQQNATAVQAMLKKIGIEASLDIVTGSAADAWAKGADGVWLTSYTGSTDPSTAMSSVVNVQLGPVPASISSGLTTAAGLRLGSVERNAAWQDVNKALQKDPMLVFLCSVNTLSLFGKNALGTEFPGISINDSIWDPRFLSVKK